MRELILISLVPITFLSGSLIAQLERIAEETFDPLSVLITEVLFDPEPVVGLPPYEYIEVFNKSPDTANLEGWFLRVGDKQLILTDCNINPGQYAVLTKTVAFSDFDRKGLAVIPLDKWPVLKNSGQFIALLSPAGDIVHWMTYHPAQYDDALKREGGWSLELADFWNPCHVGAWHPSLDKSGGTPGRKNSISYETEIPLAPRPVRAGILDRNNLYIVLSRPVLPIHSSRWFNFNIEPASLSVESWNYLNDRPWLLKIILDDSIPRHKRFSIEVGGEASDYSGSRLIQSSLSFGVPEDPDSGDIVISEIMYDPLDEYPEFICVHNSSGKVLDLSSLYVAQCDEEGIVSRFSKPGDQTFLIFPGEEYVLTGDEYLLESMDPRIPAGRICESLDLPSLPNHGSIICLMNANQLLLDKVRYEPGWHDPHIGETKGISLERIRLDISGCISSNWHSASSLCGGSTPGMENSQAAPGYEDANIFSLENRAFYPDGDGLGDYLLIRISAPENGWFGHAGIWDLSGHCVRELSEPGFLPTNGVIKWDGNDDFGNRVPPGYYIILINYFRPDGKRGRWKEACVVIRR